MAAKSLKRQKIAKKKATARYCRDQDTHQRAQQCEDRPAFEKPQSMREPSEEVMAIFQRWTRNDDLIRNIIAA